TRGEAILRRSPVPLQLYVPEEHRRCFDRFERVLLSDVGERSHGIDRTRSEQFTSRPVRFVFQYSAHRSTELELSTALRTRAQARWKSPWNGGRDCRRMAN